MDENKKTYQKPNLQKLGHIAQVTQKTGPNGDTNRSMKSGAGQG